MVLRIVCGPCGTDAAYAATTQQRLENVSLYASPTRCAVLTRLCCYPLRTARTDVGCAATICEIACWATSCMDEETLKASVLRPIALWLSYRKSGTDLWICCTTRSRVVLYQELIGAAPVDLEGALVAGATSFQ
eukprot:2803170-Rhodomonas_salina.3